jgi:hypothetical protein
VDFLYNKLYSRSTTNWTSGVWAVGSTTSCTTSPQLSKSPTSCCTTIPQPIHNKSNKWGLSFRSRSRATRSRLVSEKLKAYREFFVFVNMNEQKNLNIIDSRRPGGRHIQIVIEIAVLCLITPYNSFSQKLMRWRVPSVSVHESLSLSQLYHAEEI